MMKQVAPCFLAFIFSLYMLTDQTGKKQSIDFPLPLVPNGIYPSTFSEKINDLCSKAFEYMMD